MLKNIAFSILVMSLTLANSAFALLLKDQTIVVNGTTRSYDIYLPSDYNWFPRPLVLLLHGHGGNADIMTGQNGWTSPYKVWLTIAEEQGWFLVIPDGEEGSDGNRGWNDCRGDADTNPNTDDVKFLNSLVDTVAENYPINENRIYAHGTSNGGNMAYRLALESGDKYRAVAAVVASMAENDECQHSGYPVSVLIMNGTDDPFMPYEGGVVADSGERGTVISTDDTVNYWITNNEITSAPIERDYPDVEGGDGSTVHSTKYRNRDNNTEVILYKIIGGGHTEPSLSEFYREWLISILGNQNQDIEMAEEAWKFFFRNR